MRRKAAVVLGLALLLSAQACATRQAAAPRVSSKPSSVPSVFWSESFDEINPEHWREAEVRRDTQYEAVDLEGRRCLRVASQNGASILMRPMQFDADTYEWLSWDWRVDRFVAGETLSEKGGSDNTEGESLAYFDEMRLGRDRLTARQAR